VADSTAENALDHNNYAGFWLRFLAAVIDIIVYIPFYYGIGLAFNNLSHWWAEGVFFVFALLTYAWFFASPLRASPGMYLLKFHICDVEGERISYLRALMWGISGAVGWSFCFAGVIYLQSRFDIFAVRDLLNSCQTENMAMDDCQREIETLINIPFASFIGLTYAALALALFLSVIWALSIALPKDKTGFHNLICGTRFVKGRA